ncbi:hypothetical protein GR211_22185 [Rhizobium leguminosarum]|nr:hypothetical protein [Rhizobium ruizarguesonis]NEJ15530.1 hypothetical protein [Rhizobium ruizarguesonis]NEK29605.1 hypothetical protein [Rhizobium ruizarguesonis]
MRFLTLRRGEYRSDRSAGGQVPKQQKKKGCPDWLARKYRSFRVIYRFEAPSTRPAALQEIRRIPTGEWAGVYTLYVHYPHQPHINWTETYIWVWRNNQMEELQQIGLEGGYRYVERKWFA